MFTKRSVDNSIVLGVDIGGSHITSALVNLKTKKLVTGSRHRVYVNTKDAADRIITKWTGIIRHSFNACTVPQRWIGFAMPGPFDYETGIALMKGQDKFDAFYGLNVKNLLARSLKIEADHIRFMNDAECFLRGESFCGAASNCASAMGITLGTGLGSSILEKGGCYDADLWCSPFKGGIAEEYLSTRWFTKQYHDLTGKDIKGVKALVDLSSSDPSIQHLFDEFGKNLALFLNEYIDKNTPEVVIIGGNISKAYNLFEKSLHQNIATQHHTAIIKKALLGEKAQLMGAASCWYREVQKIIAA